MQLKIHDVYTRQALDLTSIADFIGLRFKLSAKRIVHIYLYDPTGQFVAECFFDAVKTLDALAICQAQATLNAKMVKPVAGQYELVVLALDGFMTTLQPFVIDIDIVTDRQAFDELTSLPCQSQPFFLPNARQINHQAESRFYKGDFHGHTTYSDGRQSAEQAMQTLDKSGLDFMALTEHNRVAFGSIDSPVMLIPSFELTVPTVHINLHGVADNELFRAELLQCQSTSQFIEQTLTRFADCNISLNHMFLDEWRYTETGIDIRAFNTIEIICDPTYPTAQQANDKAIAFLDFLWNAGYQIYGIGGSDSHNLTDDYYPGSSQPSIYGDPATYVYCQGLSIDNVIDAVKRGHCYVTRGVSLHLSCGNYLPGDHATDDFIYQIGIENPQGSYCAEFIVNGKVVSSQALDANTPNMSFDTATIEASHWWLRVALYQDHAVVAYVNPIYRGQRQAKSAYVEDLIARFNDD